MKKLITTFFIIIAIVLIGNISNASSDFTLNSIHFDATINTDGSMNITETWNIKVHSMTNTLFKTFKLNSLGYSGISNVKVSEVVGNNEELDFKEKNIEVLHVDKNAYYGLVNSKGDFEIAWGINETSGNKTYKISYKVNDCVKKYSDTAEVYWQFIGKEFDVDIDKVTGTIITPNTNERNNNYKEDPNNTFAWAHGPLNGNIKIESNSKVNFDLEYLDAGNYLEVRLAMPPNFFDVPLINMNRYDTIKSEEERLANEANTARENIRKANAEAERQKQLRNMGLQGLGIIFAFIEALKIKDYIKALKENKEKKPEFELQYYREIPDETATPSEAGFLYYFGKSTLNAQLPKIFSATILDLALKQFITFETVDSKKKKEQIRIKVLDKDISTLQEDEQKIYELLQKIQGKEESFNMKDLEKYARNNYSTFLGKLEKVPELAEKQVRYKDLYDSKVKKEGDKWQRKMLIFFIIIIFAIIIVPVNWIISAILIIVSAICMILCKKISKRLNGLTQKGVDAKEQWKGLKNYMKDYSKIDDREVPELVIWEKYLIYATVFGIADEVLKQLKVQYPELMDENYTAGTYMGLMYSHNLDSAFINSLNQSVASAYSTGVSQRASYDYSNSSSGGGFGGGFSGGGSFGGGGFGGGGGRRPLKHHFQ